MAEMMKSEQFASVYVLESHFQYKDIGVVNIFNSPAGRAVVNQTVSPEKKNKTNNRTFCTNKTSNPETAKFVLTPETLIDLKSNHFNNYSPPIDYNYPKPKGLKNNTPIFKPNGNLTKNYGSSNFGFENSFDNSINTGNDPFNQIDSFTSTKNGSGSYNKIENGSSNTFDSTLNKFNSSPSKKNGFDNSFVNSTSKNNGSDNSFESSISIKKCVEGFESSINTNPFENSSKNNDCFESLTSSLNGFDTNLTDAAKSESILSNCTNQRNEFDSSKSIINGFNSDFDISKIIKDGVDFIDTNLTDEVKEGENDRGTNTGISRRSINGKITTSNKDKKEQLERARSLEEERDKKKRLEEVRISDKIHSRSADKNLAKERRFSDEKCDILRRIVSGFLGGWTAGSVVDIARWRKRKSSEELYREASLALGIPCELTDSCRCLECQCHYFDCGDTDSDTSETSINLFDCDIEEMSYDQTSSNHNSDVVFYEDETNETCYSSSDRQISIDMPSDSDDDQNQREIARIFDNDNTENEEKEWNGGKTDRSAPAIFQDGDDLAPTIEIAAGTPVILDHLLNNPMTCALQ